MRYKCLETHAFNGHEEDEMRSLANAGMRGTARADSIVPVPTGT